MNTQNSNRIRAKLIISLVPGIHLRKLQKLLGASFSTTRHHVENLERDSEVVSFDDGRYHRLYPAGTAEGMKMVYAAFQSKTARQILRVFANNTRGLTNGELSDAVGRPRSTISEYVAMLCNASLVTRSFTVDGRVLYEVQGRGAVLQLLAIFEQNLLSVATDHFVDLWDF